MAVTDKIATPAGDINAQLADLRAQLNQLIEDKAMPMLNDARDSVVQKVDDLSGQVRSRPFTTIAITAAVAFLAGRLLR
jgi:ElaB/YqjD/DUF883 family membrane-anchored ribosome-binding protein